MTLPGCSIFPSGGQGITEPTNRQVMAEGRFCQAFYGRNPKIERGVGQSDLRAVGPSDGLPPILGITLWITSPLTMRPEGSMVGLTCTDRS